MSHPDPLSTPPPGPAGDAPTSPSARAPRDVVIARAERQLAMLDRLAELAMELAEAAQGQALAQAAAEAAAQPPARPVGKDPAETFVRVTRVVRLTLAMQMRLEETIRILRESPDAAANGKGAPSRGKDEAAFGTPRPDWRPPPKHPAEENHGTRPEAVRDLVWDVVNHDLTDLIDAQETLDALHERLIEGETYDEALYRPLKEAVQAVCEDLNLTPDWSRWTGAGWAEPITRRQWQHCWAPADGLRRRPPRGPFQPEIHRYAQPPDPP